MKRFGFLLLALVLLLAILPAAAQSTADLTTLAQYFPGQTPVYVSLRTDGSMIASLEALQARFATSLPAEDMDEQTLSMALDEAVADMLNPVSNFEDAVRPWLGDSAAVGMLNLDSMIEQQDEGPFLIALSITDREEAQSFFEAVIGDSGGVTMETTSAYTLMTPAQADAGPGAIYIDDQVLLITNKLEVLPTGGMLASPLSDQEQFQAAVSSLPAETYSILVYADYGAFMSATMAEARTMNTDDAAMIEMLQPMFDAFGGTALGFTLLDEQALTMDLSLGLEPSALPMMADMSAFPPFDPAFAIHLPAGTQLAVQGANLSEAIQQNLASLADFQAMAEASGSADPTSPSPQEAITGLNFLVRGATGLDLEDDILSWMTGQYAVGMSLDFDAVMNAAFSGDMPPEALSFGLVIENTDNQGAEALVAGLNQALNRFVTPENSNGVTVTEETIGGAPGVVITDDPSGFQLAIGGNDAVFAIGTPDMVRAALAPDGGLDSDPAYQEALTWALDGAPVYLYGNGNFFNNAINLSMFGTQGQQMAAEMAPLFSSSSISENYDETALIARFVLTLAQ